jgi:hypothetical protein
MLFISSVFIRARNKGFFKICNYTTGQTGIYPVTEEVLLRAGVYLKDVQDVLKKGIKLRYTLSPCRRSTKRRSLTDPNVEERPNE